MASPLQCFDWLFWLFLSIILITLHWHITLTTSCLLHPCNALINCLDYSLYLLYHDHFHCIWYFVIACPWRHQQSAPSPLHYFSFNFDTLHWLHYIDHITLITLHWYVTLSSSGLTPAMNLINCLDYLDVLYWLYHHFFDTFYIIMISILFRPLSSSSKSSSWSSFIVQAIIIIIKIFITIIIHCPGQLSSSFLQPKDIHIRWHFHYIIIIIIIIVIIVIIIITNSSTSSSLSSSSSWW